VKKESTELEILKVILGIALLGALFIAGWAVYRSLPSDAAEAPNSGATNGRTTVPLRIVIGSGLVDATLNSPVELYPFDFEAARREFQATFRSGKRFEEFLSQRMKGLPPVEAPTESPRRAVVILNEGTWLLRATASLVGGETIEWRLPVNVSESKQTVELTTENAYEHTKKF
jgi:hypothetical protein